jgi:hypothetical protein
MQRLELPLSSGEHCISFDILSEEGSTSIMTGHLNGLITWSLTEADDAQREARRDRFREPYKHCSDTFATRSVTFIGICSSMELNFISHFE